MRAITITKGTIWLGLLTATILALWGCTYHVFPIGLAARKPFESPAKLHAYVNGPSGKYSTLWEGTFYVGDRKESSYFLHRSLGDSLLTIPAKSWTPPLRFPRTHDKSQWLAWDQYSENLSPATDPSGH